MLLMGKLTISMAIFNSYVKLPECICSNVLVHVVAEKNTNQSFGRRQIFETS